MKGGGVEKGVQSGGGSGGKGGGQEKGVKALGGSDIKNSTGVQGGWVGDDGDNDVGKRGGYSTMTSYLPKKRKNRWAVLW